MQISRAPGALRAAGLDRADATACGLPKADLATLREALTRVVSAPETDPAEACARDKA